MHTSKISAFVICHNREHGLAECLQGVRFADEVIVIDKSSTDGSQKVARGLADKVVTVPFSPTVEESRALALSLCQYEWILFMDDDECLHPDAGIHISSELDRASADIYEFQMRHFILGRHDEKAYYFPEYHIRLFRRGTVSFVPCVHAGLVRLSERVSRFTTDPVAINHFTSRSVSEWIEKTNRYTNVNVRYVDSLGFAGFRTFAHTRIDYWFDRTKDKVDAGYPAAVALLRAVYDLVDASKIWEATLNSQNSE